ncbi:recombination protein F [Thiorhodovibrio litoralis]|nr:recombination protein F [Thiorhodovibrio litoralis]
MLQIAASQIVANDQLGDLWLIDDLGADLSRDNSQRLLDLIRGVSRQMFITAIENPGMTGGKMFHVEQGQIQSL